MPQTSSLARKCRVLIYRSSLLLAASLASAMPGDLYHPAEFAAALRGLPAGLQDQRRYGLRRLHPRPATAPSPPGPIRGPAQLRPRRRAALYNQRSGGRGFGEPGSTPTSTLARPPLARQACAAARKPGRVVAGEGVVAARTLGRRAHPLTSATPARVDRGGVVKAGDDVYAGHDGHVWKKTDSGWQSMVGGQGNTRQGPPDPSLERDRIARHSGSDRIGGDGARPDRPRRGAQRLRRRLPPR